MYYALLYYCNLINIYNSINIDIKTWYVIKYDLISSAYHIIHLIFFYLHC